MPTCAGVSSFLHKPTHPCVIAVHPLNEMPRRALAHRPSLGGVWYAGSIKDVRTANKERVFFGFFSSPSVAPASKEGSVWLPVLRPCGPKRNAADPPQECKLRRPSSRRPLHTTQPGV